MEPTRDSTPSSSTTSSLSTGSIAGLVIGALAVVAIVFLAAALLRRHRARKVNGEGRSYSNLKSSTSDNWNSPARPELYAKSPIMEMAAPMSPREMPVGQDHPTELHAGVGVPSSGSRFRV
jgi:hypothetical protein